MTNFALADAAGICVAFVLFSLLAVSPGYLLSYLLNLWRFRARTAAFQLAASVCVSFGFGPIATFLLGLIGNWGLVWLAYSAIALAALLVFFRDRPKLDKAVRRAFLAGATWCCFAGLWLMDWQFSSRVYFPIYAFDYGTRAEFIHSLAAFGLPAQSPVFNPGHAVALHYHFLWFLQCALVHWVAPVLIPARVALIAGAIWCGLGLMSIAALAMRLIFQINSWIAILLLASTGLDLIPNLLHVFPTRMHLTGTLHSAIGEPHYICALIACLTGFLVLWDAPRIYSAVIAGLCFATAVGSGSFVALVFAVFLAIWMVMNIRHAWSFGLAGILTVIFSLPYLLTLRAPAANVGGESLLAFVASPFAPTEMPVALQLLSLPLFYLLQFGFVAVCVCFGYRKAFGRHERMLLVMAATSVVICSFVESCATPNNDLGWRGFLAAQTALLLLAAAYVERNRLSGLLKALLFLGLLGNAYDMVLARVFPILSDMNQGPKPKWLGTDQKLGDRTFANREAYAWLRTHSDGKALIGQNPDVDSIDVFSSLYGDRNIVAGDRTCTIGFGGLANECAPIEAELTQLYAGRKRYAEVCELLPASFYVVKDTDQVWANSHSWIWTERPLYANQYVRIFGCDRSNYITR